MKVQHGRYAAAAIGAALVCCSWAAQGAAPASTTPIGAIAAADLGSAKEEARLALRDGNYAKAAKLTSQIAVAEPDSALNWYRLAISSMRSGDPATAMNALTSAEAADPRLTFASSPQRFEALRAEIRDSLPKALASKELDPAALDGTQSGSLDAVTRQLGELGGKIDRVNKSLGQMSDQQRAQAAASRVERAIWIVGFAAAALLASVLVVLGMDRAARLRRSNDLRDLSSMPLQQLIIASRDTTSILLQRLQTHEHQATEIYSVMQRVLPVLERESGRAVVRVGPLTQGKALADVAHSLGAKAPVLGRSNADVIHKQAVQAALAPPSPERLAA
jgi:tetratricopeptide (TPR) repeat protein